MENELQGNILGTGFTGNVFEISRNPDISLDDYFVRERCDRFSMALASLCTTIASDKIHFTTVQRNYPIGSVDLNRNHSSDVLV